MNTLDPGSYLARIVAEHRQTVQADKRSLNTLLDTARCRASTRGFRARLAETDTSDTSGVSVIAEIKRRSPSKGDLRPDLDPAILAEQYQQGGAACLSVLTDRAWFAGSVADLQAARNAVDLPVLRKDFTVDERDIADARIMGADCVLLIVAALDDSELQRFCALARDLDLDALVEVHDEVEMQRALEAGADLVGVNQRDLLTFEVDQDRAERLASLIPDSVVSVAESGIDSPNDIARLSNAGYDAVLVGESLVRSSDPVETVRALVAAGN